MVNYRNFMYIGLAVLLSIAVGCGGGDSPASGDVPFEKPEDPPGEVREWMSDIEDLQEPHTDWMVHNDSIFVAVARGEVPHPGHGVEVEAIRYEREGDEPVTVSVEARHTEPDKDTSYIQVISYPVAVARFELDDLPDVEVGDIMVRFDVDDSAVVEHDPEDEDVQIHSVVLFFSNDGYLERDVRAVEAEALTIDLVLAELMIGPETEHYHRTLPEGTKMLGQRDDDDPELAIVDFSEEILGVQGSLGEQLAVYSVVNTLVENELDISRVQFTVDGEEANLGHMDFSGPLEYDEMLVRESK